MANSSANSRLQITRDLTQYSNLERWDSGFVFLNEAELGPILADTDSKPTFIHCRLISMCLINIKL